MFENNRCYNSGPISSLSYLTAVNNFRKADVVILERFGMHPVNPMEVTCGLNPSAPWCLHMLKDILLLLSCRFVYFQEGWANSRGAKLEYRIAKILHKDMLFAEEKNCDKP